MSNTLNVNGTRDVLSISGNVDGDVITGLFANPNQPNSVFTPDGFFIYDNTFDAAGGPYLTNPGLLFTSASFEYNLFSDNATQYELYQATPGVAYTANSIGTFVVTQVPEPATWGLMVAGFGLVGFAARRRATSVAA